MADRTHGLFSIESIQTQTDNFGERLESMIAMVVDELNAGTLKESAAGTHPAFTQMSELIFDRLGLKVHFITNENLAAILPFYSNKSHIFIAEMFRGQFNIKEQDALLRTFNKKKGSVNLEKATVDGIFSEYDHPVYLNVAVLSHMYKLSPAEIAACLLHELGHGFQACYYADRTDRTNQVLAGIARRLHDTTEKGDIEYVYRELQSITKDVSKEEVDKVLNGPRTVAGATWFRIMHRVVRSITADDTYNNSAFEQQADAFAARFGYARHLTLGLDKLTGTSVEKSGVLLLLAQILDTTMVMLYGMLTFAALASGSFFGTAIFGVIFWAFFRAHGEDLQDFTYDKLKMRYVRVRNDLVDQLKTMKSDRKAIEQTLESIYDIDLIIKETRVLNSVPTRVVNAVFSSANRAAESIADQQLMEALASNDLYINAAELRTL